MWTVWGIVVWCLSGGPSPLAWCRVSGKVQSFYPVNTGVEASKYMNSAIAARLPGDDSSWCKYIAQQTGKQWQLTPSLIYWYFCCSFSSWDVTEDTEGRMSDKLRPIETKISRLFHGDVRNNLINKSVQSCWSNLQTSVMSQRAMLSWHVRSRRARVQITADVKLRVTREGTSCTWQVEATRAA